MTTWPHTTRAKILANAKDGYGNGLGEVWYSQDTLVAGYRADCSGFVCRALGLTSAVGHGWWGGLNTVSLVSSGALVEIHPSELQPGDLAGTCGPGTAGDDGHVTIFAGWDAQAGGDHYHQYEQCGNTRGPIYTTRLWGYVRSAYRYAGITTNEEDDMPTVKEMWGTDGLIPAPTDAANYNANKTWTPANSLAEAVRAARSSEKQVAALTAAVQALAKSQGMDPDKVYAAIEAGSQQAVAAALAAGAKG